MKNFIETIQFKIKCAEYHYQQASNYIQNPDQDTIHRGISEFCAMMDILNSGIYIAKKCAYRQSTVEAKAFMKSLDPNVEYELQYIEQFLKANRNAFVFEITDDFDIFIQSMPKKHESDTYPKRKLQSYMLEVKPFAEQIIQQFLDIYQESSAHFDQSWRIVDMNSAYYSCQTCGAHVTEILFHVGNLSDISLKEKEQLLPRRKYVYGYELHKADLLPLFEVAEDEILIPHDGLESGVKKEPASGCCGSDSSKFNVFCKNDHPIGKEAADCWMPHFIRIPMDKVKKNEVID